MNLGTKTTCSVYQMQKRPQQAFMIKTLEQIGLKRSAPCSEGSSKCSWESWKCTDRRMKPVLNLLPHTKINSKGIKDQNVKPQALKLN